MSFDDDGSFVRTGLDVQSEAGSSEFDPLTLSPIIYYHAEDCSGVGDGGAVATWTDRSGNGWTWTKNAGTVLYRANTYAAGVPSVEVQAGGDLQTANGISAGAGVGDPGALFMACKCTAGYRPAIEVDYKVGLGRLNEATPYIYAHYGTGSNGQDNPTIANPHRILIQDDKLYVNDTLRLDPVTGDTIIWGTDNLWCTPVSSTVQIGCVLFWTRALDATERTNLFTWAANEGWT